MELLIKGARIIDASQDFVGDVYVKDGIIEKVGKNIKKSCYVIDAKGLVLMPSFVDTHAHFRDPGLTYKEDLLTGSMAAVKGGYTGVNLMANTKPVCSSVEAAKLVNDRAQSIGLVDVHQCMSITRDFSGSDISHLDSIDDSVRIISEDGRDVESNEVMLMAMKKAKDKDLTVMVHCEDAAVAKSDSRKSENIMTKRNIEIAKEAGCKLHVAHVSTKEAMEDIIEAKKDNYDVTCEVMPHHIALTAENNYTVNPPLREREDVEFLIEAIKNNLVDTIGTDHAPHSEEDKENGAPGISGIETAFSVCYTTLVRKGHITLSKLSELMSKNPALLVGFNKGMIKEGCEGDLVLVDLDKKLKISSEDFASKGKNTPFESMEFYGEVLTTIKGGNVVYSNGYWYMNGGKTVLGSWWLSA